MELLLLLFAGGIAFLIWFVTIVNDPKRKFRPAPKSQAQLQAEADALAHARRLIAQAVLLRQATFIGDTTTERAILNRTYDGPLPEKQDNGSWTSPYPQLLALPIAGINYRSSIKNVVGSAKAKLVEDPKNEFDPNAIKVIHESGTHVGFIPEDRTDDICHLLPCYVLCDIEQCEDDIEPTRHYFRGWLYINTQPSHIEQTDVQIQQNA